MSLYPTKEEIMSQPVQFKKETTAAISEWKRTRSKIKNQTPWGNDEKFMALRLLIDKLNKVYNTNCAIVYQDTPTPYYSKKSNTITMNSSLSVISTLHEFAHHLFGPDELKACRWSIWLFKQSFPKSFDKLTWKEHMLVKEGD
jgi:hypothetical protein